MKYIFIATIFIMSVTNAFAHSKILELSSEEIHKMQTELVDQGYLTKGKFKPGIADLETEIAYDKSIIIKNIEKQRQNSSTTINKTLNTYSMPEEKMTFWQWLTSSILSIFK